MNLVIEVIGILATVFIVAGFVFKDEKTIRIVNMIGAVFFVIYGISISALSVWLSNGILILIHIYHLSRRK
jgi:uncharacterized protein with PQ loop repeat